MKWRISAASPFIRSIYPERQTISSFMELDEALYHRQSRTVAETGVLFGECPFWQLLRDRFPRSARLAQIL
jgi:hypothetical protein